MAIDNDDEQLDDTKDDDNIDESVCLKSDLDKLTARRRLEEYMEMKRLREQLDW